MTANVGSSSGNKDNIDPNLFQDPTTAAETDHPAATGIPLISTLSVLEQQGFAISGGRFIQNEKGEYSFQILLQRPGSPVLPPPGSSGDEASAMAASTSSPTIQEAGAVVYNSWLDSVSTTAMTDAMVLMALGLKEGSFLDKKFQLKEMDISFQLSKDAAVITMATGHMLMMESIMKAITIIAAGTASMMVAHYMPQADAQTGANKMATFELFKAISNAATELVSATYAVPKATLEAQKQILEAIIQQYMTLIQSAADSSQAQQDAYNQLMQQLADWKQKFIDSMKTPPV